MLPPAITAAILLNDSFADRVQHDVGGGVQVELLHQAAAVSFDGVEAHAEQRSGFLVGFSFGDELEDYCWFLYAICRRGLPS